MANPVFDIRFANRSATIANIFDASDAIQLAVRKAVEDNGNLARNRAEELAPASEIGDYKGAGTRRLKRSITLILSPDKLVWEVASDIRTFSSEGQRYYAPYVEANSPFLEPAHREFSPKTRASIGVEIRKALKRREIAVRIQGDA